MKRITLRYIVAHKTHILVLKKFQQQLRKEKEVKDSTLWKKFLAVDSFSFRENIIFLLFKLIFYTAVETDLFFFKIYLPKLDIFTCGGGGRGEIAYRSYALRMACLVNWSVWL